MINVKINGPEKKMDIEIEGTFGIIVPELMYIIDEVFKALDENSATLKEIAKGFLIESIGKL